jgi:hypothetical protein
MEIPFTYYPRERGSSHARVFAFGMALCGRSFGLWTLRSSIESADYDERAFYSPIPLQRWWQRRATRSSAPGHAAPEDARHRLWLERHPAVDQRRRRHGHPPQQAALHAALRRPARRGVDLRSSRRRRDLRLHRMLASDRAHSLRRPDLRRVSARAPPRRPPDPRHARLRHRRLAHDRAALRVLRAGRLQDEHITHYTRDRLIQLCREWGFALEGTAYVFRSELVLALRRDAGNRLRSRHPRWGSPYQPSFLPQYTPSAFSSIDASARRPAARSRGHAYPSPRARSRYGSASSR